MKSIGTFVEAITFYKQEKTLQKYLKILIKVDIKANNLIIVTKSNK